MHDKQQVREGLIFLVAPVQALHVPFSLNALKNSGKDFFSCGDSTFEGLVVLPRVILSLTYKPLASASWTLPPVLMELPGPVPGQGESCYTVYRIPPNSVSAPISHTALNGGIQN